VWGTSVNFDSTLLEKEPALRYEELNGKLVFGCLLEINWSMIYWKEKDRCTLYHGDALSRVTATACTVPLRQNLRFPMK
jgi:hypothetical protein